MLSNKLITTYSCSIKILSNDGTEYKNKIVEVSKKLKTGRMYTSPYHPQSIGKLEGWHRMLHDSMRKMIQDYEAIRMI